MANDKPKAQRMPCPKCRDGIVGHHLRRHIDSKACQVKQKRHEYTRAMFDELDVTLAKMIVLGKRLVELATELRK